jgi:hypothetical protein
MLRRLLRLLLAQCFDFWDEAITFSFKLFQILLYLLGFAQHRQAMR